MSWQITFLRRIQPCFSQELRLRLKRLRKAKNLKQWQVAECLGIAQSTYCRIEKPEPDEDRPSVQDFCEALEVSALELILGHDPRGNDNES